MRMKLTVLQHAAFEGPGEIGTWAEQRGYEITTHHLYRGDALPPPEYIDILVVMGGEMNIYQYRDWPWLKAESTFIRSVLERGTKAVGICLGAQLISDALGGKVVQNADIELGWLPVVWTSEARAIFPDLPAASNVLHWHGDTFSLPAGATRLAISDACAEQGYVIAKKCLGLQFHLEVDPKLVEEYVAGQNDWPEGPYCQTPKTILTDAAAYCEENRCLLRGLLDGFCG
jgi:GMP synthase-like glutamine amidotransferase